MSLRRRHHVPASVQSVWSVAIATLLTAATAVADTLTLGTGISQTWNRSSSPAASPVMTLAMLNDTNNPSGIIVAYTLGMRLQPVGGATGTLSIGTISNPAANPVFTSIITPPTVNVQSGFTSIAIENSTLSLAPVSQAGANAIDFTLVSSDAVGTFNIVIDGTLGRSGWNDLENEFSFGNANNTTLTVGQINVVPEPGMAGVAIVGAALSAVVALRVRRRRASQVMPTERA